MQENSGLTKAIRKEKTEKTTITPVEKGKLVTKDDLSLIKKSAKQNATTSVTISVEQRKQDKECFKADSERIRKRLEKKDKNIGNEPHDKSTKKAKKTFSKKNKIQR